MPRGAKGTPALPKSKGSITSFFNGTSKALRRLVECPVCSVKVEEGQINKHMDGPNCKLEEGAEISIIEVEDKEKKRKYPAAPHAEFVKDLKAEKEQNTSAGIVVKTEGPKIPKLVGKRPCGPDNELNKSKRQKTKEVTSCDTENSTPHTVFGDQELLQQRVNDDSIISDLLDDKDWNDEDSKDWVDEDSSQQKILLSPSISYNPARYILIYGNIWSLS